MSAQKEINGVVTLGWVVLLVMFVVAVIIFGPALYYRVKLMVTRHHDSRIFKAAEEARRDFD